MYNEHYAHFVVKIYKGLKLYVKYMANLTALTQVVTDLFGVLDVLIEGIVNLMTGNLLVLAVVGAFVTLIVSIIYVLIAYIKKQMNSSISMKK